MLSMKNRRSISAQGQPRPSSIISRILAHHQGASAPETTGLFKSVGGVEAATGHNMLSTPFFLTKPSLLT